MTEPIAAMPQPTKPRVDVVDYAKGIGILLVVVAHVWRGLAGNGIAVPDLIASSGDPWARNGWLDRWVYAFHMPLFFFLSGLFLYRSAGKNPRGFLIDKAASIAWPFVVWSAIYWLLARVGKSAATSPRPGQVDPRSIEGLAWSIVQPAGTHLWFLYTLFFVALVVLVLRLLRLPAWGTFLLSIAFMMAIRLGLIGVGGEVFKLAMFLPYVTGAAVLAPRLMSAAQRWPAWPWAIIAVIGAGIVTYAAMLDRRPGDPMFSLYSGWAGIAMTLSIARLLELARLTTLKAIGLLSLEIYLAHIAVIAIVRTVLLKLGVTGWPTHLAIDSAAGVIGPIVLALLCRWMGFNWLFRFQLPSRGKRG